MSDERTTSRKRGHRRSRKRSTSESFSEIDGIGNGPWKKVDVGLSSSVRLLSGNHYDNEGSYSSDDDNIDPARDKGRSRKDTPSLLRSAEEDLEASAEEGMGFFYGLEVISADQYSLETDETGVKRFHLLPTRPKRPIMEEASPKSSQQQHSVAPGEDEDAEKEKRSSDLSAAPVSDVDQVEKMQLSWLTATGGVTLHPKLCRILVKHGFWSPTPIQAATLPASILGNQNVVGAAPTGSGKTLSFLLPIYQELLQELDEAGEGQRGDPALGVLRALVLAPTRELALQIHTSCEQLLPKSSAAVVGGMAIAKQNRLLDRLPPVVIGTPGRLWDLLAKRVHPHLKDLSQIRHLVIDEADRMIKQGSFPELSRILDAVHLANPMEDDDDDVVNDDFQEDESDTDRLHGLPGIRGEARVDMLSDDILQRIQQQQQKELGRDTDDESTDNFHADAVADLESADGPSADDESDSANEYTIPTVRRTFVYSATLTLPSSSSRPKKASKFRVEGAIAEIMERARAKGKTKIVDLTNESKAQATGTNDGKAASSKGKLEDTKKAIQLPPGLAFHHIKCAQVHKDSHLYAFVMSIEDASRGPCLVFCNSIAAVRRVGATLQTLGLETRILHAQMQQRARLKAVESLQKTDNRSIVVATDVAARGLDLPSVSYVVHYDVPRTVDVFIHRSGRTARGMGEGATGSSLALVAPGDDRNYSHIMRTLGVQAGSFILDGRLLRAAQERVALASKIILTKDGESKLNRDRKWMLEQASEAGLEIDASEFDVDDKRRRCLREAVAAEAQLARLLAEPLQVQRYGKFLSTNSAFKQGAKGSC